MLLAVLDGEAQCQDQVLLGFFSRLSRCLGTRLGILVPTGPSLAHYGQVDTLASFRDKEEFVRYVRDTERDEARALEQLLLKMCPDAEVYLVQEEDLPSFFRQVAGEILFAATTTPGGRRGILSPRPAHLKAMEKAGINLLTVTDRSVIEGFAST